MKRLKNLKENIVNKAVQYKMRLEVFFITLLALFGTSTYAYADISGETMKNNVINNYLVPFCVVVICFILLKEVLKKNVAGIVIWLTVGGFVLLVVSTPDIIKTFGEAIKKLFGI
ncbi:TcpD [Clostridium perfringens]|uniref:conjugal transfer membrane protein TcpD n=1 Tax=Clostridium perfringens TaxID=1502 RepID=UPI0013E38F24|nr:conjugal transfer membrane protein TcpD [Clostridium perfringens]MBO3304674.1 TcpD [Clostridium perfringens]MBO3308002.1 TcpD [Clostridium perfringens]MBO3311336.1 TcpD [Clostridium perfringens]MBO3317671.1 TcpD [Clostridium perfringens]MBO3392780.1 TcpD [Clostridium perfringens]